MKTKFYTQSHSAANAPGRKNHFTLFISVLGKKTVALLCALFLIAGYCNAQCQAGFTYTFSDSVNVSFTNTCTGGGAGTHYFWNFGDGFFSSDSNATHTYTYNGIYSVCVSMADSDTLVGCWNSFCDTVVIRNGANPPCNASFSYRSDTVTYGGVWFYDQSSGNPVSWSWDFGDGNTSNQQNPIHKYAKNGYFTVCLTSFTSTDTCSYCDTIIVQGTGCGLLYSASTVNASCISCNDGSVSINVSGGVPPYTYIWSTGATTLDITGLVPGNYQYSVTDSNGCTGNGVAVVGYLGGTQGCSVSLSIVQDSTNLLSWFIYPTITGTAPFIYFWTFGDGDSSTLPDPTHTYAVAGHYSICLVITDDTGCTSSSCDSTYRLAETGIMQYMVVENSLVAGINKIESSVNSIYPNPANDRIEISLSQLVEGELSITDITGREIYKEQINSNLITINSSKFPSGCYNLSIVSETKRINKKIMIAR